MLFGEIDIVTAEGSMRACAGDAVLIPPFTPHGFKTNDHCDIWITVFSPSMLSNLSAEICASDIGVFRPSGPLFEYLRYKLVLNKDITVTGMRAALFALGEEFVAEAPQKRSIADKSLLPRLFLFLAEHYKEDISLAGAAHALGYSESYISHAIGRLPEMSFTSLLSGIRIDEAKRLLRAGELPIGRIAHECGFGCERSFHRAFSSIVGKSPREYRRNLND